MYGRLDGLKEYNIDRRKTFIGKKLERVKTGISKLDDLLSGGFPKNSITLVSGPPGSGKTIVCCQFLYQGIEMGDKCLFLTLDRKIDGILTQAKELDLDFQPAIEKGQIKFLFLNINNKFVYETMTKEILTEDYTRVVLDSITQLSEIPLLVRNMEISGIRIIDSDVVPGKTHDVGNVAVRRFHIQYILNALEVANSTSVITSELPQGSFLLSRDGISEFITDGVIVLTFDPTINRRKLSIIKMRSTKHTLKPQDIVIEAGGVQFV